MTIEVEVDRKRFYGPKLEVSGSGAIYETFSIDRDSSVASKIPYVSGGYRTILIDPPWAYDQKLGREDRGQSTRGGLPYRAMDFVEILALHPEQFAAKDCQLWLWITNSHLPLFSKLLTAWSFEYRGIRTWVKGRVENSRLVEQIGLGYWLRGVTEHLLLATRGNPRARFVGPNGATGFSISSVLLAERGKHSEKPEQSYLDIEKMSEEPRLELFARRRRTGWTTWGDQVDYFEAKE